MGKANRIIAVCVTAAMAFQLLAPAPEALAQEVNMLAEALPAVSQNDADNSNGSQGAEGADTSSGEASGEGSQGTVAGAEAENPSGGGTSEGSSAQNAADGTSASEGEAANAQDDGDYAIKTVEGLKAVLGDANVSLDAQGKGTIKVNVLNENLLALSDTDPKLYRYATITRGTGTGAGFDVTGTSEKGYTFKGFGSDDYPFEGSFVLGDEKITLNRSLFNNMKLKEDRTINLEWKGTDSQPIVAKKIDGEKTDGNSRTLTANVKIARASTKDTTVTLASPLLGDVAGSLNLETSYAVESANDAALPLAVNINASAGNIGLLANTVTANGTLKIASMSGLPDNYEGTPTIRATGEAANAGGLIGECESDASVEVDAAIDLSRFAVVGANASGGFIGKASNLTLTIPDGASVKPAQKVGDADSVNAGGLFGSVSFSGAFTIDPAKFGFTDDSATIELGAKKRAGGLFGSLDVTKGDVIIQGGTYESKLTAGADSDNDRGSYGGIAGNVRGGDGKTVHALTVQKKDGAAAKIEIERTDDAKLCYVGGVAGYQDGDASLQKTAIVLDGVDVTINGAAYAYTGNGKLGGAVGVVDKNQLLDVRDFKLSSTNPIGEKNGGSAGIAGSAWRGIIKFSGTTDLSKAVFANSDLAAQLVYQNYNALIFATGSGSDDGWKFKRPSNAVAIDDIYSYGEVIRLGDGTKGLSRDLIAVDDSTHVLTLSTVKLSKTDDAYVLSSADDFAKLAITWQTFGYFSMVDGISGGSVSSLASSAINVAGEISLAGTGLTGLSKDRSDLGNNESKADDGGTERESAHYFSGKLTGSGTINLAVGEPYGMRGDSEIGSGDTSDGNGKIYRHGRLGLFNAVTAGAQTDDKVTVGGTMRFENGADIDAGSLAAQVVGTGAVTVSNATFSTAITFDSAATDKILNVGGIFGSIADAATLTLGTGAKVQATISTGSNAADIRVGQVAGYVAGENAATIDVTGLEVGGRITAGNHNGAKALGGGLIGFIQQGSAKKNVTITGLSYNGFAMTVGTSGDSKNGAGGLLGYSWGNAIVTIGGDANNSDSSYALTTNNAIVTADSATEFGGLLYAMSGHLIIQNHALDLTGASLGANSATSLGVLLARGGTSDKNKPFGVEDAYTGLYLEDKTPWSEAYKVVDGDSKLTISAKHDIANFDEWVAHTTKPGSTTSNGDCNAVISLRTTGSNPKLYMGNDGNQNNSYRNRTEFGEGHKTNPNSRYYYNLDYCLEKASPSGTYKDGEGLVKSSNGTPQYWAKSAEALMIWSVCRYAPAGIREYIAPGLNFNSSAIVQIGNSTLSSDKSNYTTIDLDGYSYYPVDSSGHAYIRNSTIVFHYSDIKNEQAAAHNKSNAEYTQHANMHMALFRVVGGNFEATNVTLAGSVGSVVAGSDPDTGSGTTNSGALICRSIGGALSKPLTASLNQVYLDSLVVDGIGANTQYAPLLINTMPAYVSLTVKKLSVKDGSYTPGTKAATSLFGRLGGDNAQMATASFSDNVCVPGKRNESIFTRATFLESFGYKEGSNGSSASYIFYKNEKATYGNEIDANDRDKNENRGKQLWYYDEDTYQTNAGLVKDGSTTANADTPAFGGYLPYVAVGWNRGAYHEIKVNQRIPSIKTGCGTYTDPFVLSNELEIVAVADYINNMNSAKDEWEVTITEDQSVACTRRSDSKTDNEITYKYRQSSGDWASTSDSSKTLSNNIMHTYMQSAYYSIEPKNNGSEMVNAIELDTEAFQGFGNEANPFRGVIVGNLKNGDGSHTQLTLTGGNSFKGLIPYSYGSVVKDLDIVYQSGINVPAYTAKNATTGVPTSFFGGVIGCIMGGDNIIDGVSVSSGESSAKSLLSAGFDALASLFSTGDDRSYLVPTGGYVGAICGGGVIFRGMSGSENWRGSTANDGKLYDNPYVGRVIDGFAFSEGCDVDNGNENYKVNRLYTSDTSCITTDQLYQRDGNDDGNAATTIVKDAQGLLVLSAIINSGAAAGPTQASGAYYGNYSGVAAYKGSKANTRPYSFGNGSYGKVRNAAYTAVGKPNEATGDVRIANNDDQKTPGAQSDCVPNAVTNDTEVNSPYLVAKYADKLTGYICAPNVSGVKLQFGEGETSSDTSSDKTFDMRGYGSGFLGLSGRYYSNACNGGEKSQDRDRIVPAIGCIDGNGYTVLVDNQTKQYTDDDYSVQAVGGLFSAVMFANLPGSRGNDGYLVKNLQFGDSDKTRDGAKSSTVSLTFVDRNGNETSAPDEANYCVGMLAGTTANRESMNSSGKYSNVRIESCSIESPKIAGGLLGASGWARRENGDTASGMIHFNDGTDYDAWKQSPVKLFDCSYEDIDVAGGSRVGGFVGALGSGSDSGIWVTNDNLVVGQNSTIRATANNCIVGGAFGISWSPIWVNTPADGNGSVTYKTAKMSAVTIENNNAVGSDGDGARYRGTGGIVGNAQSSCEIKDVLVEGAGAKEPVSIGGTAPSNNGRFQSAGGVIGQVNATGDGAVYNLEDVIVRNAMFQGKEGTGGLVGTVLNGSKVQCSDISVSNVAFGETFSGGLVGTIKNAGASLEAKNVKVENCTFSGEACSAISGDGKGTFNLSNVLMSRNKYGATKNNQGLLLGKTWSTGANGDLKGLYVAGLDIVPEDGKSTAGLPDYVAAASGSKYATPSDIHKVSYVALANYNDDFSQENGSPLYNDERDADGIMLSVDSASPYVTTNPVSSLEVQASETAFAKKLFSDGVATYIDDTDNGQTEVKLLADKIKSEAGSSLAGKYTYTNIGGIDDSGAYQNKTSYDSAKVSTFNANNSDSKWQVTSDFPVLLISGNDTTTIESYLNIITNGGFSDACRLNPSTKSEASHVTATMETFELKEIGAGENASKAFIKTNDIPVVSDGTDHMKLWAPSDWDNEKHRFTLLTVTFHEAGTTYKVQVPIIVKRMLEIDFAATYSEGTNFNSADYGSQFNNHVLISSGDTMTGYLTWTYNQALGTATEYGWNSLLASGGSMACLDKTINFEGDKGRLPEGTQLTLIDTAHGDKEYHFTVGDGGATSVKLTAFCDNDKAGTHYEEQWLSEIFGAKATEDASGAWVKLNEGDDKSQAGAKVSAGDEATQGYYRKKTSADTKGPFYTLTVSDETPKSENFYLIVRTPEKSDRVNGYTDTSVTTELNKNINSVLRATNSGGSLESDPHQNTASTYSIASNYTHKLRDNLNLSTAPVRISPTDGKYSLQMDVSDTISFGSQEFADSDELYFQLDSSLVNYKNSDGTVSVTGGQGYPTGTSGTYSFYVAVGDTYYTCERSLDANEKKWVWRWTPQASSDCVAAISNVEWAATGGDMSIRFDDSPANSGESRIPIDLSGIRKIAEDKGKAFTITMRANLTMSENAGEKGIVASQNDEQYTKPRYRAALSTHASTLSTSSNTSYNQGNNGYYRAEDGSSTITLEASMKSQLGINIDDLSSADGTIGASGTYDLKKLNGVDALIEKADRVKYALTLQKRVGTNEDGSGTYLSVPIGNYVKGASASIGNVLGRREDREAKSFVWEDVKDASGNFATRSGNAFQLPLTVEVDTTKDAHTYANYRLVLTAQLCSGDTVLNTPSNTSDYITYTLTRVNLEGIKETS